MVIAKRQDDHIVVGVSSDTIIDISKNDHFLDENLAFWKVKGEKDCYVFAMTTCFESGLLRYNDKIFKGITDAKSIIENVVPKMKALLDEYHCFLNGERCGSSILIVKGNKMFIVNSYFIVSELKDLAVLGFSNYFGADREASDGKSAEESILFGARVVEELQNTKLFPMVIFNTKTNKKKVYYN